MTRISKFLAPERTSTLNVKLFVSAIIVVTDIFQSSNRKVTPHSFGFNFSFGINTSADGIFPHEYCRL